MSGRTFAVAWCGQAFLRELVLIYPTSAIMMQAQGVSALSLSLLFIIWSTAAVLLEVPSGVLADRMSRHTLLVLSGAIKGCAFLIWLAMPEFWGFALGFVVWSLGSALRSGTSEAFLHDTLAQPLAPIDGTRSRRSDLPIATADRPSFEQLYGWEQAASSAGVAIALLLGGWLAEGGYVLPLLLSALAPWSSALLVMVTLREPPRTPLPADEGYFGTLTAGIREVRTTPVLILVVAMISLLPTVYDVVEEFVPPLLHELEFSLTAVGVGYALAFAVRAAAVLVAYRLRAADLSRLCWLFMAGGAVLAVGAGLGGYVALLALCGYFALSAVGGVLLQGRLQRSIAGHARATVTSLAGMLQELLSLGFYLAIGVAGQLADWQAATVLVGGWLVLSALTFRLIAGAASRPRSDPAVPR